MDILVRDIYSKLKAGSGVENIVVAGGCVRDFVLGGKFTDVDIYIPLNEIKKRSNWSVSFPVLEHGFNIPKEFTLVDSPISFNEYKDTINNVIMKYDLKWKDIDIDLMVVDTRGFDSDEESFGSFVTKGFDFGLNMIYYDGFTVVESEEFSYDKDRNILTLQKLESMGDLNLYLERASKIQKKYPNFRLDLNKVLQLKTKWVEPLGWRDQVIGGVRRSAIVEQFPVPPIPVQPVRNQIAPGWFEDVFNREFNRWIENPLPWQLPDINND